MTDTVGNLATAYIAPHASIGWTITPAGREWVGNAYVQPRPISADAALECVPGAITRNQDGSLSIKVTVTNHGPNETWYSLLLSRV
jgi:hypothetical protein